MILFVAVTEAGDIVGTVGYQLVGKAEGHIRGMAVRPGHQGSSVAQQLLDTIEAELRRKRCSRISLDTTEPLRRAISFYTRNGFQPSGRVSDFFGMPLFEYVKVLDQAPPRRRMQATAGWLGDIRHRMTCRRIDVFFYGLFMDAEALRTQGVQPVNPRRACVPGFALRIGQRATLVPDPEARVYGVLMELSHDEIERLYAEPGLRVYRPEAVIAELDDAARIPALCFNLPVPPGPEEANEEYAQRLRALARRLGLPAGYVDRIA